MERMDESRFSERFYQYAPKGEKEETDDTNNGKSNYELSLGAGTL
jgi:hypothetical protein